MCVCVCVCVCVYVCVARHTNWKLQPSIYINLSATPNPINPPVRKPTQSSFTKTLASHSHPTQGTTTSHFCLNPFLTLFSPPPMQPCLTSSSFSPHHPSSLENVPSLQHIPLWSFQRLIHLSRPVSVPHHPFLRSSASTPPRSTSFIFS